MENLTSVQQQQLQQKGISPQALQRQFEDFKKGFPFAVLRAAAIEGHGVESMAAPEMEKYTALYRKAKEEEKILKFVPASGAATRMFKALYSALSSTGERTSLGERTSRSVQNRRTDLPVRSALNASEDPFSDNPDASLFFAHLSDFAFYPELSAAVKKITGQDITAADPHTVLDTLLENPEGLLYGKKPKALLRFHKYPEGNRLALEEHLVEGALYAASQGVCRLHFTISPEHRAGFELAVAAVLPHYEKKYGIKYEISYSEQKPSTDTPAVTLNNEPFLDETGRFVFRPGGHGALIENLNERTEDIIFVKNIDNVTTDALRADTVCYKELLAGVLIDRRNRVYEYARQMENMKNAGPEFLQDLRKFVLRELSVELPEGFDNLDSVARLNFYKQLLNRPMRVCGMVRNTGEPGGGPFWVLAQGDKAASLQIVESSQVDIKNPEQEAVFKTARFFNPVDLVCSVYNHKHQKYDLREFIDPQTAFISQKSVKGTDIKAMELPGLWNGAMAKWLTLFVEVPGTTFTPVKTVNDLLRPAHN